MRAVTRGRVLVVRSGIWEPKHKVSSFQESDIGSNMPSFFHCQDQLKFVKVSRDHVSRLSFIVQVIINFMGGDGLNTSELRRIQGT